MTRTEGATSSRSQKAATSINEVSLRPARRIRRRLARRELLALPVALALLVPTAPALAATGTGTSSTGTSGYNQKPPTPKTTPEPKKEVEPAKEEAKTTPTPTTATEPTTTTAPTAKAATLPFTGLDLRWVVGAGLLLLAFGLSIRLALRGRPGAGH